MAGREVEMWGKCQERQIYGHLSTEAGSQSPRLQRQKTIRDCCVYSVFTLFIYTIEATSLVSHKIVINVYGAKLSKILHSGWYKKIFLNGQVEGKWKYNRVDSLQTDMKRGFWKLWQVLLSLVSGICCEFSECNVSVPVCLTQSIYIIFSSRSKPVQLGRELCRKLRSDERFSRCEPHAACPQWNGESRGITCEAGLSSPRGCKSWQLHSWRFLKKFHLSRLFKSLHTWPQVTLRTLNNRILGGYIMVFPTCQSELKDLVGRKLPWFITPWTMTWMNEISKENWSYPPQRAT